MKIKDISKMQNKIKGDKAERLVINFLKKKKYKIIETNFKNKIGEIDIVAKYKDVFVFVEVKARETLEFGRPIEAVNFRKQNKIKTVAELFLLKHNASLHSVRFDVVEVLGEQINHIENAFS